MSCGDVEANPGPMQGPSAGGSGGAILQELGKSGMQQAFQLFFVRTPEEGPSGGRRLTCEHRAGTVGGRLSADVGPS